MGFPKYENIVALYYSFPVKRLKNAMRRAVFAYLKEVAERFNLDEPILDTCAGWEPNFYQPLFPGKEFIKQDMRDFDPPCIDIICDITDMTSIASNSIGLVLNLESLQHIAYPQKALDEIHRLLKPNGLLVLTTHMFWPIMHHPKDYWRFCPHGMEILLNKFKILDYTLEGSEDHPTGLWFVAQKTDEREGLGELPAPRLVRVPTNWIWYWLVKNPLEKVFKLEIRRLTPDTMKIPRR